MRLVIDTTLAAQPEAVWDKLQYVSTLQHITRGLLGFRPTRADPDTLNHTTWSEGQRVTVRLWLFHVIPLWVHHLGIERIDVTTYTLKSRESGGLVSRWDHLIVLKAAPDGRTHYTDELDIEAGLFTPVIVAFAWVFYHYRQWRWRELARTLQ